MLRVPDTWRYNIKKTWEAETMMNETIKTLLERRSIRGYKKDLVPAEILDLILEAGEYAPSGMGMQGTMMVVTQNAELVAKLSQMNADVM